MSTTFLEIETYPQSQPSRTAASLAIGSRMRAVVTSRTSTGDIDHETMPPNAAIGDEQVEEQQRQQDLRRRLVALEALFFDDYGLQLKASSRSAFECFMKYSPMAMMPLLGAEPQGTLVATWSKEAECLSLRFTDRYHLDFAVSYRRGPEELRHWGPSSLASVFSECPEIKRLISS